MSKLEDIYNIIKNPLDNKETLLSLLDIYLDNENKNVNSENRNRRFNNRVQHFYTSKSNKHISKYHSSIRDNLYSELFEIWKNNITHMTKEKYAEIYGDRGSFFDNDFQELINYLEKLPSPTTYNEVISALNNKIKNPLLNSAINKYSFITEDPSNFLSSWTHITSSKLAESKNNPKANKHCLYVNVSSTCVDLFVTNLLSEFLSRKMNFDFEFDRHAENDNSVTIYLSDNDLDKGLIVLENARKNIEGYKKENPQKKDDFSFYNPPILSGTITKWIGYGAIPQENNSNGLSYLELRGKEIIPNAISNSIRTWFIQNKESRIKYNNLDLSYFGYITKRIFDDFMIKTYKTFEQHKYNSKSLDSKRNRRKFLYHITNSVDAIYNQNKLDEEIISLELDNKEYFTYTKDELENAFNIYALDLAKEDPSFLDIFKQEIEEQCKLSNLEPNKFCFNKSTLNSIKQHDAIETHIQSKNSLQKEKNFKEEYKIKEPEQINTIKEIKPEPQINHQISDVEIAKRLSGKYLKNANGQKVTVNTVKSLFELINSEITTLIEKSNNKDITDDNLYSGSLADGFTFTITKSDINSIIDDIIREQKNKKADNNILDR